VPDGVQKLLLQCYSWPTNEITHWMISLMPILFPQ